MAENTDTLADVWARRAAITPGEWFQDATGHPWNVFAGDEYIACCCSSVGDNNIGASADAEFITSAPADLDRCKARIDALESALDDALGALEGLTGEGRWRTYQVDDGEEYCVYCGEPFPIGVGEHAADCPVLLAAAIVRRLKGDGA